MVVKHIAGFLISAAGGALLPATESDVGEFTIDPIPTGFRAFLIDSWAQGLKASGIVQVRSRKLHDDNNPGGWRKRIVGGPAGVAGTPYPLWPQGVGQEVISQDVLHVDLSEETVAGSVNVWAGQLFFEAMKGSDQRLITNDQLWGRLVYPTVTVELPVVPTALGVYTGAISLVGAGVINNLKPNSDYALLGIDTDVDVASVTIKGPDTSNTRIGVPGAASNRGIGREYFVAMNNKFYDPKNPRPLMPIINSAAQDKTIVEVVCAGPIAGPPAGVTVTLQLGLLR